MPRGKIRIASLYGNGAVMGFTPQQIDAMSMWQFMASAEGYVKANSGEEGLSASEVDELWDWINS